MCVPTPDSDAEPGLASSAKLNNRMLYESISIYVWHRPIHVYIDVYMHVNIYVVSA